MNYHAKPASAQLSFPLDFDRPLESVKAD
jgi:hypothetical protein